MKPIDIQPTVKYPSSFVWKDKNEDAHAEEYIAWMKENIAIPRFCEFYDASKAPNLLSTTAASERFIFTGTLDVGSP